MNGTIVLDGTWDAKLLKNPITLKVVDGLVTKVSGNAADDVKAIFVEARNSLKPKDQASVWTVAEFGFGMNPRARLIGNVLEDEKVQGTCYFAIGDNTSLGGNARCGIHVTGVITEPSVELGDLLLLSDGDLKL